MNSSRDANKNESSSIVMHYIEGLDSQDDLSLISCPVPGKRMIVFLR